MSFEPVIYHLIYFRFKETLSQLHSDQSFFFSVFCEYDHPNFLMDYLDSWASCRCLAVKDALLTGLGVIGDQWWHVDLVLLILF